MLFLSPNNFSEYELIDSGNFMKLERFGSCIISRPEPQAVWHTSLNEKESLSKENLKKAFDMYDKDGSGSISSDEIR